MKDFYSYGAIFTKEKIGYSVNFPDLIGCYSEGDTLQEAKNNCKEALEGFLYLLELDNGKIPEATNINKIQANKDQIVIPIEIDMKIVREEMK